MDLAEIQELLKIVAESGVAEVEIEEDDFKLTVRQNAPTVMMQPSAAPSYGMGYYPPAYGPPAQQAPHPQQQAPPQSAQPAPNAPANGTSSAPGTAPAGGTQDDGDTAAAANETVVKAPIVGTFYRAPSPDSDPYVAPGDTVGEGDILCIIEAMKLMNEIECETPGTIKKILVDNAEPVEFDQPLFVMETD